MQRFLYWIVIVSRGYSVPMSILNWLVVFSLTLKITPNSNILYPFIALVGIIFAHLGTNLFDDCIDYLLKVPKQECKTEYLETKFTDFKTICLVTGFYFLVALMIGLFFVTKFGMPIFSLILIASVFIILYPRLNNYALGEVAVGLCFGVLLFMGISFIMTSTFQSELILISIPVSLLTVAVLYAHSLMDFDFDKKSGKFTLCQLQKTKQNALWGLMIIYFAAFLFTIVLVCLKILPMSVSLVVLLMPLVVKLYKNLKYYNSANKPLKSDFLVNFKLARNISVLYNIILIVAFCVWK